MPKTNIQQIISRKALADLINRFFGNPKEQFNFGLNFNPIQKTRAHDQSEIA